MSTDNWWWFVLSEPNAYKHVLHRTIPPKQLAKDFQDLYNLLRIHPEFKSAFKNSIIVGPDVTQPFHNSTKDLRFLKTWGQSESPFNLVHLILEQNCEITLQLSVSRFLKHTKLETLDAITWHQYYENKKHSTHKDFTDPAVLDLFPQKAKEIWVSKIWIVSMSSNTVPNSDAWICRSLCTQEAIAECGFNSTRVWLGETGSISGRGLEGYTDGYADGFLYVWRDLLSVFPCQQYAGPRAKLWHKFSLQMVGQAWSGSTTQDWSCHAFHISWWRPVFCSEDRRIPTFTREWSVISGACVVVSHWSQILRRILCVQAYWLSLLHKILVGTSVMNTSVTDTSRKLRLYAHCANTERLLLQFVVCSVHWLALNVLRACEIRVQVFTQVGVQRRERGDLRNQLAPFDSSPEAEFRILEPAYWSVSLETKARKHHFEVRINKPLVWSRKNNLLHHWASGFCSKLPAFSALQVGSVEWKCPEDDKQAHNTKSAQPENTGLGNLASLTHLRIFCALDLSNGPVSVLMFGTLRQMYTRNTVCATLWFRLVYTVSNTWDVPGRWTKTSCVHVYSLQIVDRNLSVVQATTKLSPDNQNERWTHPRHFMNTFRDRQRDSFAADWINGQNNSSWWIRRILTQARSSDWVRVVHRLQVEPAMRTPSNDIGKHLETNTKTTVMTQPDHNWAAAEGGAITQWRARSWRRACLQRSACFAHSVEGRTSRSVVFGKRSG